MSKSKGLHAAEVAYKLGDEYYKLAVNLENQKEEQKKIDASWGLAAKNFWMAFTLGNEKAALSLFKCFKQGVGVLQDDEIASLMYGIASKITPEEAQKIPVGSQPIVLESLEPKIKEILLLIKKTQGEIPSEGVDMQAVWEQMKKFNDAIKLNSGNEIKDYFTDEGVKTILEKQTVVLDKHYPDNFAAGSLASIELGIDNSPNDEVQKMGESNSCCTIL